MVGGINLYAYIGVCDIYIYIRLVSHSATVLSFAGRELSQVRAIVRLIVLSCALYMRKLDGRGEDQPNFRQLAVLF